MKLYEYVKKKIINKNTELQGKFETESALSNEKFKHIVSDYVLSNLDLNNKEMVIIANEITIHQISNDKTHEKMWHKFNTKTNHLSNDKIK